MPPSCASLRACTPLRTRFFPLKDAAAVLHPSERLIAYHLFWEDDIDFPDDNDPCDHEVVWVQFSPDRQSIERFWTYFHGRILEAGESALRDARDHEMRPRVNVQWGKHGSMPFAWESMAIVGDTGDLERAYYVVGKPITLADYNRGTWQKLRSEGRRLIDHPLARRLRWPDRFTGEWERFVDFSRAVDLPSLIKERRPDQRLALGTARSSTGTFFHITSGPKPSGQPHSRADRLERHLRRRTSSRPLRCRITGCRRNRSSIPLCLDIRTSGFMWTAPWQIRTARRCGSIADQLRGPMRLREDHGPFTNAEGCDFEVRLEHLQPWESTAHRPLQHAHAFHMRYYHTALEEQKLEQVVLRTAGGDRRFYRVAASAHYEVEHTNPNHADVEICPVCGRTGEYQDLKGNLVEMVHDPLGLEFLLKGTIRNQTVTFEDDQREIGGIGSMQSRFALQQQVFAAQDGDKNTLRIGVVVLAPLR